ncbi:ATP-binding protein [Helicobacter muridarum]|uniref:ATP-binding protein n=1 Tax=Helicobacter muridarum TaxID=216 RepID=A0A377PWH9_9HELI|nr:ATP-binding protein [Helicobacter muridarum]TLE01115.1 ATP-binding protein [Helicobacter muridarum]STQ85983.1 ATPase [Helicobacter muridarum]
MEFLIDFFTNEDIENTNLFPLLNCSKHEAVLLREMVYCFFKGENYIEVSAFLENLYSAREFEILPYLKEIKHLGELGWISGADVDSTLELRNANISLSSTFLCLLENGQILRSHIKAKNYRNALEYLQDEWNKLECILQCNNMPALSTNDSLLRACNSYIIKLESIINNNLTKNTKKLKILRCFEKYHFNKYEKLIFLLLAQAQYNGLYGLAIKEIILLGNSEEEKITIQQLLSHRSKLVKQGFVAFSESFGEFSFMEQEAFIPHSILNALIFEKNNHKINLQDEVDKSEIFDYIEPKKGLDFIILDENLKQRFKILLQHLNQNVHKKLKLWGIKEHDIIDSKILLYGDSGTGKTSSAYALAKDLNQKILSLDCSKILSMYVGESEKNVRKIFDEYRQITDRIKDKPILLLDEADQLLSSRGEIGNGAGRMYHQMQNIFLEQIEKFRGILIATTNFVDSLDSAFSRRFHYKIRFQRPNKTQRTMIWELHLPKNAQFSQERKEICQKLSEFDLSGGQIKIIVENTCYKVAVRKDSIFSYNDFYEEIKKEQNGDFGVGKKMGFISIAT